MHKKISLGNYDDKHKKNLNARAKKINKAFDDAISRTTSKAAKVKFNPDDEFYFDDFPALKKAANQYIDDLTANIQMIITEGDKAEWQLSNTKNDALVDYVIGTHVLPEKVVKAWKHPHLEALKAFIDGKDRGFDLSKSVWNIGQQFRTELELALELGLGQGKSAAKLSQDVRGYLQYPDKLFRRVRQKDGALRLSKAAAAFHPGAGVYRSSYRNALRMTATENNIAYRTADHTRWGSLDFVIGISIQTSNNHPEYDICDELAGRYPKDFVWTGWHPWCRCYATSILASEEQIDAYCDAIAEGKDVSKWNFTGVVNEMPEKFDTWMEDNKERVKKAKSVPYFIRDNFVDGDPEKGLNF
nr:hypothetical protein [uncultured Prevotella sp.]